MHVEFDELRGEVRVGGASAPCAASGRGGELRLGGAGGMLVAPVTFGERSAAAAEALNAAQPRATLCAALRARGIVSMGPTGAQESLAGELVDCVVLALAGSDDARAPSFADSALTVLRATRGEFSSLLDAPAREVDRLSIALVGEPDAGADGAWTRLVLTGEAPSTGVVRDQLADALLFRAAAPAGGRAPRAVAEVRADRAPHPAPGSPQPAAQRPPDATSATQGPRARVLTADARDAAHEAPAAREAPLARYTSVRGASQAGAPGTAQPDAEQAQHPEAETAAGSDALADDRSEPAKRRAPAATTPGSPRASNRPPIPSGGAPLSAHDDADPTAARDEPPGAGDALGTVRAPHGGARSALGVRPGAARGPSAARTGPTVLAAQAAAPASSLRPTGPSLAWRERTDDVTLDVADDLAAALQEESDLRGIGR